MFEMMILEIKKHRNISVEFQFPASIYAAIFRPERAT
jgi:hypothetical protein